MKKKYSNIPWFPLGVLFEVALRTGSHVDLAPPGPEAMRFLVGRGGVALGG